MLSLSLLFLHLQSHFLVRFLSLVLSCCPSSFFAPHPTLVLEVFPFFDPSCFLRSPPDRLYGTPLCVQLLVEYLLSRQQDEAAACVKELDCSLFHHEIVKRAVKVGETTPFALTLRSVEGC